jgi:hypothetical protein
MNISLKASELELAIEPTLELWLAYSLVTATPLFTYYVLLDLT